jgi:hypothetical protein
LAANAECADQNLEVTRQLGQLSGGLLRGRGTFGPGLGGHGNSVNVAGYLTRADCGVRDRPRDLACRGRLFLYRSHDVGLEVGHSGDDA